MPLDRRSRPLRALRLSVTDRCNLRCQYCMPESKYDWVPRSELLTFEELSRLVDRFIGLGVRKVRLTGGEPLLRADLPTLVKTLAGKALEELALTTNGVLLGALAQPLFDAGLRQLTVSLDTLSRTTFVQLARRDELHRVLDGLDAARTAGFSKLKLDTVLLRGVNDHELDALVDFAAGLGAELRFIEYMDVGGATRWEREQVVTRAELLSRLTSSRGTPHALPSRGSAPAERFALPSGQIVGIVASTTQPFCGACDRARVSADGQLFTCLYGTESIDLRSLLRGGADDAAVEATLERVWNRRVDRGAEARAELSRRGPLADAEQLKVMPQLEMHRRGG
ncbi:MAG: GTP 3',8-cyclase MoaA [Myxococcales bacterium]|nr:GTP 3',8-cyclase MoaA [Myxococcales bacterium]